MFDSKSDYAVNKLDQEAIVYQSSTGEKIRLTAENFASKDEFLRWKLLSDTDYHDTETAQQKEDRCLSLDANYVEGDSTLITGGQNEEAANAKAAFLRHARRKLTQTQYRRLLMYYVDGMTEVEIAAVEGCSHQGVSKSLQAASKKLQKISTQWVAKRPSK